MKAGNPDLCPLQYHHCPFIVYVHQLLLLFIQFSSFKTNLRSTMSLNLIEKENFTARRASIRSEK